MARIDRHRARRAQIHVAQAHDQVAGVEHNVAHVIAAGQPVDALDEVHIVRQPRRVGAHGFLIALHRAQRGRILEGHGQVDHARGHLQRGHVGQAGFDLQQAFDQRALQNLAAVIADLQRAHARRQFLHARDRVGIQRLHQQVNAHAQRQVQHVVAVFQQQVAITRLAVRHRRARALGGQGGDDGFGHRGGHGRWRGCLGRYRRQRRHALVLRGFQRHGLRIVHAHEADAVARLHLAHLPQFGARDGDGAHKAAQAGTVARQDDRAVAREIDAADGVFAIVDIGRVQARLAAVLARPGGLGADQAYAQAVRVVVHFPIRREEGVDGFGLEEVRRAMRAVQHADFPGVAVGGNQLGRCGHRLCHGRGSTRLAQLRPHQGQHVAHAQRAAGVPAELAQRKGRAAAQVNRHVQPVAHGQVAAAARQRAAGGQHLARTHGNWLPHRHGFAVQRGGAFGAGQRHDGVAVKAQGRPNQRGLDAGRVRRIADDAVGQAEGIVVHRARGWHADVPVAGAAGVVLHAGVGAGFQHFDRSRPIREAFQEARGQFAGAEAFVGNDLAQVVQVGGNAVQPRARQRVRQLVQGRITRVRMHDQLGQHGVVERRHVGAGRHPAIHPYAFREGHLGQHARRRLELA